MSGSAPDPRQGEIGHQERSRSLRTDCAWCGDSLTGRQRRFCSQKCNAAHFDAEHPRINRGPEGPRQGTIIGDLLGVLHDGEWHTAHEMAELVRAFPHSVSARLSELRRKGFRIESDAEVGNSRRAHRFRLVLG